MGFFEILLVAVVALLVVGPERMPEAVRTVALTIGRIKRAFQSARSEIEEHIGADEIRWQLHNEKIMASAANGRRDLEESAHTSPQESQPTTHNDNLSESSADPTGVDDSKSRITDRSP